MASGSAKLPWPLGQLAHRFALDVVAARDPPPPSSILPRLDLLRPKRRSLRWRSSGPHQGSAAADDDGVENLKKLVDPVDDDIQVYRDILTPSWRVVYSDPSSSLSTSSNRIDSESEAASPHLEARNITSQEILNLDQMGTVINDEHKPVNSSVEHSP